MRDEAKDRNEGEKQDGARDRTGALLGGRKVNIRRAVKYLKHYMQTYMAQEGWEDYATQILVDDVLYALGVAISPGRYRYAAGFRRFKADLAEYLKAT